MKKMIAVTMLATAALTLAVFAPSSSARDSLRPCGTIPFGSVYNVTASPSIPCRKARKIIKRNRVTAAQVGLQVGHQKSAGNSLP